MYCTVPHRSCAKVKEAILAKTSSRNVDLKIELISRTNKVKSTLGKDSNIIILNAFRVGTHRAPGYLKRSNFRCKYGRMVSKLENPRRRGVSPFGKKCNFRQIQVVFGTASPLQPIGMFLAIQGSNLVKDGYLEETLHQS